MAKTVQINMVRKSSSDSSPQMYDVSFKVVDDKSLAAIQGASIVCRTKSALTNTYGVCLMSLPMGNHKVAATHPDYDDAAVIFVLP